MDKKEGYTHVTHTFLPVYNKESQVLVLGSFPSVKSREQNFYYGHPQNRFWKVTAFLAGCPVPQTIEEKKEFFLANGIAVWDVIASCDIIGSADSTIKNVKENDMRVILDAADIRAIFTNGTKAHDLFQKYCRKCSMANIPEIKLPSTSPANAAWSLERLTQAWTKAIGDYI